MFLAGHGGGEDRPKELEEQEQGAGAKFVIYDQERWMARCVAWGWVVMGAQMQSLGWQPEGKLRGEDSDPGLREHLGDS